MTQKTLITVLVDRSGSMAARVGTTVSALNEYVDSLRGRAGDARLSLVGFSSVGMTPELAIEKVFVAEPLDTVRSLTPSDLYCRGGTPLLAAIWQTAHAVMESLRGRTDVKPVLVIQTDGEENTSHFIRVSDQEGVQKHGVAHDDVKRLIERLKSQGWEFVFLGCGIDAYQDGMRMGLSAANVVSYTDDEEMTRSAFRATADNTAAYLSGASATMAYTDMQKMASGDKFMKEDG